MQIEKQIPFKNWTSTDFTYSFDGQPYTFEAGKTYSMPFGAANHFANHLAIRELFNSQNQTDHALPELKMKDFINRALPEGQVTNAFEEIPEKKPEFKEIPEKEVQVESFVAPEPEAPKKKGGRPKKTKDEEYSE